MRHGVQKRSQPYSFFAKKTATCGNNVCLNTFFVSESKHWVRFHYRTDLDMPMHYIFRKLVRASAHSSARSHDTALTSICGRSQTMWCDRLTNNRSFLWIWRSFNLPLLQAHVKEYDKQKQDINSPLFTILIFNFIDVWWWDPLSFL